MINLPGAPQGPPPLEGTAVDPSPPPRRHTGSHKCDTAARGPWYCVESVGITPNAGADLLRRPLKYWLPTVRKFHKIALYALWMKAFWVRALAWVAVCGVLSLAAALLASRAVPALTSHPKRIAKASKVPVGSQLVGQCEPPLPNCYLCAPHLRLAEPWPLPPPRSCSWRRGKRALPYSSPPRHSSSPQPLSSPQDVGPQPRSRRAPPSPLACLPRWAHLQRTPAMPTRHLSATPPTRRVYLQAFSLCLHPPIPSDPAKPSKCLWN